MFNIFKTRKYKIQKNVFTKRDMDLAKKWAEGNMPITEVMAKRKNRKSPYVFLAYALKEHYNLIKE